MRSRYVLTDEDPAVVGTALVPLNAETAALILSSTIPRIPVLIAYRRPEESYFTTLSSMEYTPSSPSGTIREPPFDVENTLLSWLDGCLYPVE